MIRLMRTFQMSAGTLKTRGKMGGWPCAWTFTDGGRKYSGTRYSLQRT